MAWRREISRVPMIAGMAWFRRRIRTFPPQRECDSGQGPIRPRSHANRGIFQLGFSISSGQVVTNRWRRARRTKSAMENAIADRRHRSERRWEPHRLANGAISGPGVWRRTTMFNRRRRDEQPHRGTRTPLDCNILFVRTVRLRLVRRWATIARSAAGHLTARMKRRQSFFWP